MITSTVTDCWLAQTYHKCKHDGKTVVNFIGRLNQNDGEADGHPNHAPQEGRSTNQSIRSRIEVGEERKAGPGTAKVAAPTKPSSMRRGEGGGGEGDRERVTLGKLTNTHVHTQRKGEGEEDRAK